MGRLNGKPYWSCQECGRHVPNGETVAPGIVDAEEAALSRAIVDAVMAHHYFFERERTTEEHDAAEGDIEPLLQAIDDTAAALVAFRERGAKT